MRDAFVVFFDTKTHFSTDGHDLILPALRSALINMISR